MKTILLFLGKVYIVIFQLFMFPFDSLSNSFINQSCKFSITANLITDIRVFEINKISVRMYNYFAFRSNKYLFKLGKNKFDSLCHSK